MFNRTYLSNVTFGALVLSLALAPVVTVNAACDGLQDKVTNKDKLDQAKKELEVLVGLKDEAEKVYNEALKKDKELSAAKVKAEKEHAEALEKSNAKFAELTKQEEILDQYDVTLDVYGGKINQEGISEEDRAYFQKLYDQTLADKTNHYKVVEALRNESKELSGDAEDKLGALDNANAEYNGNLGKSDLAKTAFDKAVKDVEVAQQVVDELNNSLYSIVHVTFVEGEEVIAAGDYSVDYDGDGIFTAQELFDSLNADGILVDYDLLSFGDFSVTFDCEQNRIELSVAKKQAPVEPKPEVKPEAKPENKPVNKPASTWDDGGPFTTNAEGDVFDRWGNLIYDAPAASHSSNGYTMVNTSDR